MGTIASHEEQRKKQNERNSDSQKNFNSNEMVDPIHVTTKIHAQQYIRSAYHAGGWYDNDPKQLEHTIRSYLDSAAATAGTVSDDTNDLRSLSSLSASTSSMFLRGIIAPHAGYRYSGYTAAHSFMALYKQLQKQQQQQQGGSESNIQHIIILHPSHHVYMDGYCSISNASVYETPFGDLYADDTIRNELLALNNNSNTTTTASKSKSKQLFRLLSKTIDEEEHGAEMMYPFLYYILNATNQLSTIKITAIMVGSLSYEHEQLYGKLVAPIVRRPNVCTILSSDFCHWGKRFRYQSVSANLQQQSQVPIYEHIEQLDKEAMDIIQQQNVQQYQKYFDRTHNTICGRHAIGIFLHATTTGNDGSSEENAYTINQLAQTIQFLHYAQSSKVQSMMDSSVSYAAGVIYAIQ